MRVGKWWSISLLNKAKSDEGENKKLIEFYFCVINLDKLGEVRELDLGKFKNNKVYEF